MYYAIACVVSLRSSCNRLTVGSIITNETKRKILGIGYNGGYTGGPNKCERKEIGSCGCVHSEINSLLYADKGENRIMFITHAPCEMCAKAIINSGIAKVYYGKKYRDDTGLKLLKKAKIKTELL